MARPEEVCHIVSGAVDWKKKKIQNKMYMPGTKSGMVRDMIR
jgi:hypothetical protein